jgi:hypothetical protein
LDLKLVGWILVTKNDVIRLHREHPDWCAAEIAAALGCDSAYVRATARRNKLFLPRTVGRTKTRSQKLAQAFDLGLVCLSLNITLADLLDRSS